MSEVDANAWAPRWWLVLLIGVGLWLAAVGAIYVTGDPLLLPTIVFLGSFVIPVSGLVWYLDHDPSPALSPRRILTAFLVAGVVGILAAALLESFLVKGSGILGNIKVGLIEELVKGLLILLVAIGITSFRTRDGMVLGAAVGFGFAALESSGYAFVSLFVVNGTQLTLSVSSVLGTELVRGILAPFGHGMWSAILGGAIFSSSIGRGRLRPAWRWLGAYALVAALHAAFDSFGGIVGYVIISAIGLVPLVWIWIRAGRPRFQAATAAG
jgi:RsiW-degrading membrane proteinase PrsW (M82 family)